MFIVGMTYKTKGGKSVKIVKATGIGGPHHTVCGSDGIWRYARKNDAGRVTGSDMSNQRNLILPEG